MCVQADHMEALCRHGPLDIILSTTHTHLPEVLLACPLIYLRFQRLQVRHLHHVCMSTNT